MNKENIIDMTNEQKAKELSKLEGSAYNPVVSSLIEKKALEMAKWKEEELIEKGAAWILEKFHCSGYSFPLYYRGIDYSPERIAEDFKQAMKKE